MAGLCLGLKDYEDVILINHKDDSTILIQKGTSEKYPNQNRIKITAPDHIEIKRIKK